MSLRDIAEPALAEELFVAILRFGDSVAVDHYFVAGFQSLLENAEFGGLDQTHGSTAALQFPKFAVPPHAHRSAVGGFHVEHCAVIAKQAIKHGRIFFTAGTL